ncbi:MAG: cytochrome c3 family protein [Methanosarcinales archaeon]
MKKASYIKKPTLVWLAVLIILAIFTNSVSAEAPTIIGDIDGNQIVDINDAILVAQMVIGKYPADVNKADFNGNGRVDIGDASKIAFYVAEKIPFLVEPKNMIDLHSDLTNITDYQCLSCHSEIPQETTLNASYKAPHPTHLESNYLNFKCNDCHKSVDLIEQSAGNLRRNVDVDICATCHSPFPAPPMSADWINQSCMNCHDIGGFGGYWKDRMQNATYVNLDAIEANPTNTTCLLCHGSPNVWYQ